MHSPVAVIISAALMWASFPPLNAGALVFVAPVPFLWALQRARSKREAAGLGFLFGFAFFGGMLWWIYIIGAVAWIPLTTALGVYAAGYALVLYLARTWSPWRWWMVAVGGWAAWEFCRARFPLGGFPWGSAGYPIGTIPGARGAAQWIGPTGWGVIVIAFAAALVVTWKGTGRPKVSYRACVYSAGKFGGECLNALLKSGATHAEIIEAGGVAYLTVLDAYITASEVNAAADFSEAVEGGTSAA